MYKATEPLICRATESFLKLSGLWGYKVSKEKAQLCLPQVTYLSVFLKGQTPQSPSFFRPFENTGRGSGPNSGSMLNTSLLPSLGYTIY
jgi:hypothetical protein